MKGSEDGKENETSSLSGVQRKRGVGRNGWDYVACEALDGGPHDSGVVIPGHSAYPKRDRLATPSRRSVRLEIVPHRQE
jgi:hypothetical protein